MGLAYYPRVGIPSSRSNGVHDFHPVEQDADRRAFLYFNKNVGGFQDDMVLTNKDYRDNKGWDFDRNPLNVDGSNTRDQYVNYLNSNDIMSLDKIRIRAKWYDYASWIFTPIGPVWVGLKNAGIYNK